MGSGTSTDEGGDAGRRGSAGARAAVAGLLLVTLAGCTGAPVGDPIGSRDQPTAMATRSPGAEPTAGGTPGALPSAGEVAALPVGLQDEGFVVRGPRGDPLAEVDDAETWLAAWGFTGEFAEAARALVDELGFQEGAATRYVDAEAVSPRTRSVVGGTPLAERWCGLRNPAPDLADAGDAAFDRVEQRLGGELPNGCAAAIPGGPGGPAFMGTVTFAVGPYLVYVDAGEPEAAAALDAAGELAVAVRGELDAALRGTGG